MLNQLEPSRNENNPYVFIGTPLTVIDGTDLPDKLRKDIIDELNRLNDPNLIKQVHHIAKFIRDHKDPFTRHALSSKNIWDIICEYNLSSFVSQTFTEAQADEFLRLLDSYLGDVGGDFEFQVIPDKEG